jgi:hypothetical protein
MAIDKPKKQSVRGKNGGARPGAGRPKGKQNAKTIERAELKKQFEDRIAQVTERLFAAQMTLAEGASYLYVIRTDSDGKRQKAELVSDPDVIAAYIDGDLDASGDDEYHYITTERPDNRAIDSLLDRVFGKAPQELKHTGDPDNPVVMFDIMGKPPRTDAKRSTT